jgi:hypothetical protein
MFSEEIRMAGSLTRVRRHSKPDGLPGSVSHREAPAAVSRYVLKSDLYEFEATVDINIDIFPLQVGAGALVGGSTAAVAASCCRSAALTAACSPGLIG